MKRIGIAILVVATLTPVARSQEPTPVGPPFEVHELIATAGNPDVAINDLGNFLVVWSRFSMPGDPDPWGIESRMFQFSGAPVGDQFQLNSDTEGSQRFPAIAVLNNNELFVAVWQSSGGSEGIRGQFLDPNGVKVGAEFAVNSSREGIQTGPTIEAQSQDGFVVAWSSTASGGTDYDYQSIQARIFGSGGLPAGPDFQVNTYTSGEQYLSSLAVDSVGNFVIAWTSEGSSGSDTDDTSIQAQRYDPQGIPFGAELQINTHTTSRQRAPEVAMSPGGAFMVVWESDSSSGSDSDSGSVQGQVFSSHGDFVGAQLQVNTYTTGSQFGQAIAADASGSFTVTWKYNYFEDPNLTDKIVGRRFDSSAMPITEEFDLVELSCFSILFGCGSSGGPAQLDSTPAGDFVVVSQGQRARYFNYDIWARVFEGNLTVFADGFESGDTSAWTAPAP